MPITPEQLHEHLTRNNPKRPSTGFSIQRNPDTGDIVFSGTVCRRDFNLLCLSSEDRDIILEAAATVPTYLEGLALLFKRMNEQGIFE